MACAALLIRGDAFGIDHAAVLAKPCGGRPPHGDTRPPLAVATCSTAIHARKNRALGFADKASHRTRIRSSTLPPSCVPMTSSAFDDSASVSTSHTVLVPFAKTAHKSPTSIYKSYDLAHSVSELGELSTLDRRHSLSAVDLNPSGRRPLPITTSRPLSLGIGSLGSTVSRLLETLVRRASLRPCLHQEDGFVHEASEFLESLQHMHGLCDMSLHTRDSIEPRSSQTFERGTRSGTRLDRTAEDVVEMAIEEANGACDICHRPLWDFGALESTTTEQDELLIRMMRMMG
jgi:hypothetical protein